MPFLDRSNKVAFRYVNQKDPFGEKGLTPRTWNLTPDLNEPGKFVFMETGHPGESVWHFAANKTQADDDLITRKVAKTNIKYNAKQARQQGRDYSPAFEQETLMSGLMALITTMSRGWSGPEFIGPDFLLDEKGNPSPHCGRLVPCTAYFISQRDPLELRAVELFLQNLYEPEGEDEQQFFQGSSESLDGQPGAGITAEIVEQPAGPVPVPA